MNEEQTLQVTTSLYQKFSDNPTIKEVVTGLVMAAHHAGNWQNQFTPEDCKPYISMLEGIFEADKNAAVREFVKLIEGKSFVGIADGITPRIHVLMDDIYQLLASLPAEKGDLK